MVDEDLLLGAAVSKLSSMDTSPEPQEETKEKEILYKPKDLYERQLKKQYHQTAVAYFYELVSNSGVDEAQNALLVKKYDAATDKYNKALSALNKIKSRKGLLITFSVILTIASIFLFSNGATLAGDGNNLAPWLFVAGGISVALVITFIVLLCTKIRSAQKENETLVAEANKAKEECYKNVSNSVVNLNRIYDWGVPQVVMERATPIIDLDPVFKGDKLQYLIKKFGFKEKSEKNQSVLEVISGNIQGNPFVLEKVLDMNMINKRYDGSLVIHWTTTYRDKNGTHVEHHSQTLHAHVYKPAPSYGTVTRLVYGSEAAPNLRFSRAPVHAEKMNEKQRAKFVTKRIKQLESKEAKDLNRSSNFTKLGNDEFDAIFGAYDRNNEIEFRLLYTPLAQRNTMSLLTDPNPFGDDFYLHKEKMITIVQSEHSQRFDYSSAPTYFVGYDISKMREKFVNYCDEFIKNLFFDLAPIISVPLYQMHKPKEYIFDTPYHSNLSSYEQEVMANGLNSDLFRPDDASPTLPLVLSATKASKRGSGDKVEVDALSFIEVPMTDYVSVRGGDGHYHSVPVHWIRYDEVHKTSNMGISQVGGSEEKYLNNYESSFGGKVNPIRTHFERGLLAIFEGDDDYRESLNQDLMSLFK